MTTAMRIEREAAEWIARLDKAHIDDEADIVGTFGEANPDFALWVCASIDNRVAFLRLYGAWRRADRLAALSLGEAAQQKRRSPFPVWIATAAAACLALVVAVGVLTFVGRAGPQVFETVIGGRQTVPLTDGSRVELNTDTRLSARITEDRRAVVLEKGEAYFDVAHDESRPFVVEAGDKRVTVLGTKFTVRRDAGQVEVIVTEGRVQIDNLTSDSVLAPTVVEKGAVVLARPDGALIAKKTDEELSAELGWRRGLLVFDQMDLESVAAEFNRYNRVKLVVADPDAAAIRIGGSFKAENVDAFARLLKDGFGLTIEREGNKIVIKT